MMRDDRDRHLALVTGESGPYDWESDGQAAARRRASLLIAALYVVCGLFFLAGLCAGILFF